MAHAFRCKNCGRLETSDNAGESDVPHACCACGSGVAFDSKTGIKTLVKDNWEVLALCDEARLTELGLSQENVCAHVGKSCDPNGVAVNRTATEGVVSEDKT